jgi:hypothetical protein
MKIKSVLTVSAVLATALTITLAGTANAHVSIRPGLVIGTGGAVNAADSVTHGKSGYLYMRPGHGCAGSTAEFDPSTGLALSNTKFATHAFSVTVPSEGLGTGTSASVIATSPAAPKAQYIPGWKSTSKYDAANKAWTITWTATSADFDLPDTSANEDSESLVSGGSVFAEFGVSIKWNSDANTTVAYSATAGTVPLKAGQVCSIPAAKPSALKITKTGLGAATKLNIPASKANKNLHVDIKVDGVALLTDITLGKDGSKKIALTAEQATQALGNNATSGFAKLITVHNHSTGKVIGYLGGNSAARTTKISWSQVSGSATTAYVNGVWTETSSSPTILVQ